MKHNESGRIVRDNAYGTMAQDAFRRDFTCNALYYDVQNQQIIDFHNGLADIRAKRLVMIGDAAERYVEDPVRILRAIRLSGKLGLTLDEATAAPLAAHAALLRHEPVSRLFDELLKILLSGHAAGCLRQFQTCGLQDVAIHPMLTAMLRAAEKSSLHICVPALTQTDERLREGKSVSVGFILAALFWDELNARWNWNAAGVCRNGFPPPCAKSGNCSRCLPIGAGSGHSVCCRRRVSVPLMIFYACAPASNRICRNWRNGGRSSSRLAVPSGNKWCRRFPKRMPSPRKNAGADRAGRNRRLPNLNCRWEKSQGLLLC